MTENMRQAMKKQQAEWEGGAEEGMAIFYGGGRRGGARTRTQLLDCSSLVTGYSIT
jgi:hypothetical protein